MTQQELLQKMISGTAGIMSVRLLANVSLPWLGTPALPEVQWGGYARSLLRVTNTSVDEQQTYCTIYGVASFNVASGKDEESAAGYAVTIKDGSGNDVVIALVPIPSALVLRRGWNDVTISINFVPYKGPTP